MPDAAARSRQPSLTRLHAEYCSNYTLYTSRLAFSLDIPSDATPDFSLAAGPDGLKGGLEWKVRLAFLVSVPSRRSRRSLEKGSSAQRSDRAESMLEMPPTTVQGKSKIDQDNRLFTAAPTLAPVLAEPARPSKTEVMSVEIPVRVLAGNTAFVVNPTVSVL